MEITIRLDGLTPEAFALLNQLMAAMKNGANHATKTAGSDRREAPEEQADNEVWDTEQVCYHMGLTAAGIAYGLKAGLYPKPFTRPRQARKWLAADWRAWQHRNTNTKYSTVKTEVTL